MSLTIDSVLNTPSYILGAIGFAIATVKWTLKKQQQHEDKLKEDTKKYVDDEILRVEAIHKDWDNALKNMEKAVMQIEKKADVMETIQQDLAVLKTSMDFLKQMMWGRDVKSDAPYLFGKIETQEHKDEVETGIYAPTEEERAERDRGDFSTQEDKST